ncbi:uncharacterized protein LOC124199477 isoform X2 [Daphnia pulex]|uniref:uncharacterized protein LOC124199477 isoform X2 n=1 Tax=Daphnia pulex TaxID=6669 RepID=UPI001EDFB92F|nr:uncharacterized protein LOC124199477 isoform X2 [Daphnia pulex]
MSFNSPWIGRSPWKVVDMRQQVFVVFVIHCILVVSFTSAGKTPFLRNKSIETESQSSITEFDPEYTEMNDDLPQTILRLSQNLIHPATSDFLPSTKNYFN